MTISMNPSARYVTQAGSYERLLVGKPLTDRTIRKYQKMKQPNEQHVASPRKNHIRKQKTTFLKALMSFGK